GGLRAQWRGGEIHLDINLMIEIEQISFAEVRPHNKSACATGFSPLLAPPVAASCHFAYALLTRLAINREPRDRCGVDFRLARRDHCGGGVSRKALTTRRARDEQSQRGQIWPGEL